MSTKSLSTLKMMNVPARFGLSANVLQMFHQLDDYHMGLISEDELGKMVRLSPQMRKSITETIAKCAGIMEKKPEEMKTCVAVIQNCTEILTAAGRLAYPFIFLAWISQRAALVLRPCGELRAPVSGPPAPALDGFDFHPLPESNSRTSTNSKGTDKPPQLGSFNFLRLPLELRQRIYAEVFKMHGVGLGRPEPTLSQPKKSSCRCFEEPEAHHMSRKVPMNLAFTCKQVKDEVLDFLYQNRPFSFCCCCDLLHHLETHSNLFEKVRSLRVHWNGPRADLAFIKLAKAPNLQSLTIVVSKMTTMEITNREKVIRKHFPTMRPARLVDALGANELFSIRGLREVKVHNISSRTASRRSDEDRCCLQSLLESRLLKPRNVSVLLIPRG